MVSHPLRPGFHLEGTFSSHTSPVRQVIYQPNTQCYVSLDDKCIKAWKLDHAAPSCTREVATLHFPAFQPSFISSLVYVDHLNMYFAAALDHTLKLYTDSLKLKASLEWKGGAVLSLLYNTAQEELISAGSDGVKIWYSEKYFMSKQEERLILSGYRQRRARLSPTWCLGPHQAVCERMSLRVPGATGCGSGQRAGGPGEGEWCHRMVLHKESQILFVLFVGNVYGFSMDNGTRTFSWEGLHAQPITGFVYLPEIFTAFTASRDGRVVNWRILVDGTVQQFASLSGIASPVSGLEMDPNNKSLLTSTLDGTVSLWTMESRMVIFRMKTPSSVLGLTFQSEELVFFHSGKEVRIVRIKHLFSTVRTCNSAPLELQFVGDKLVLATFEDSSVRLMDLNSDQDVFATVPQLSTQSVLGAQLWQQRDLLFVLLANSHLHVWEVGPERPPRLCKVWNHLVREGACCFAILEERYVPKGMTVTLTSRCCKARLGKNFAIFGTRAGGLLICDIEKDCQVLLSISAFEKGAVVAVATDSECGRLVVCSRLTAKTYQLSRLQCIGEICCSDEIVKATAMAGRALIGGAQGTIVLVDLNTGRHLPSERGTHHLARITGVDRCRSLQQFATMSTDGSVRIANRDDKVLGTLTLAVPIRCGCFLNGAGDVLVGAGTRLLVSAAAQYQDQARSRKPVPNHSDGAPKAMPASTGEDGTSWPRVISVSDVNVAPVGFNVQVIDSPRARLQPTLSPRYMKRNSFLHGDLGSKRQGSERRSALQVKRIGSMFHGLGSLKAAELAALVSQGAAGISSEDVTPRVDSPQPWMKYSVRFRKQIDDDAGDTGGGQGVLDIRGSRGAVHAVESDSEDDGSLTGAHSESVSHSQCDSEENLEDAAAKAPVLDGIESPFQQASRIVASRRAFMPGAECQPSILRIIGNKESSNKPKKNKKKKRRKKARKVRKGRRAESADELRKGTQENKVIMGVHELSSQEVRTRAAARCFVPACSDLASSTPVEPTAFEPR